ncbi:hypothetical protein Tco_0679065 [Tanacetum coccineum]|uniref:Uncharacterized protein n=1 Tax=Tanacetum coccineum TaxID=301880 RepID=A0ABQ4XI57_9ASTR
MDLIHPIGQKNTLAEYMILFGVDNRPLMLDKDLYDSWKSRMELYMQNRENGKQYTESVEQVHSFATTEENGVANDLWEKVQLLMQGTSLTKQERECKLYDAFDNLPPEWSKFVTDVKLVKDLHTTNFDHLHVYLEQHKLYANEVHLMRERMEGQWQDRSKGQRGKGIYMGSRKNFYSRSSGNSKVSNEEEWNSCRLPGIVERSSYTVPIITLISSIKNDLDAYDSDCDEIFRAKAVLMANLSSYESYVLSKYLIESQNAAVQDTNSSAQQDALILSVFEKLSNQVTNCNKVNNDNLISNESSSAELERYKEWVKLLEERKIVDLGTREKLIIDDIIREKNAQFADFEKQINNLKQTLYEQSKEKELSIRANCAYAHEVFYDNNLKQALDFQNPRKLYDGNVIAMETNVISIANSEETLMLEEES